MPRPFVYQFFFNPSIEQEGSTSNTQVWAVLRLKSATPHISGKILFKLLIPTATLSNVNLVYDGLK